MRSVTLPSKRAPKAVLITPPVYDFAYFDLFSKPYGLLRIGNWLEQAGYETVHINALSLDDEDSIARFGRPKRRSNGTGHVFRSPVPWPDGVPPVKRRYARYGISRESLSVQIRVAVEGRASGSIDENDSRPADIVCIGTGMTYWYPGVREVVQLVRASAPSVPIIAGGIYASLLPEHCRNACDVDFAAVGNAWAEVSRYLGDIGFVAPADPPDSNALYTDSVWKDSGVVRLHAGCPNRCEYCATRSIHPRFLPGSGTDAFRALIRMYEIHGTRHYAFYDDALLYPSQDGFDAFLSLVIDANKGFHFYLPNAIHARYLTPERADSMKAAGFEEIRIGYESHEESFHAEFGSKYEHGTVADAVAMLSSSGFHKSSITLYVLAGLPGQSPDEVRHSVEFANRLGARVEIAEFSTVPGSALWDRCVRESQYPIGIDPIYHNNSIFPMRSDAFTLEHLDALKASVVRTRAG
jgi:hypothetical protein